MRLPPLSAALAALFACPAWAAQWDIVPSLTVAETYTDNLSLTPDALKRHEWVTQISPGISIAATGPRLQFSAKYAPELVYYGRGPQEDQTLQRGTAFGEAELAEKLLFVEAGGNVDQYDISLRDPVAASNVNATQNRGTVDTYYVTPYLKRELGSAAKAEARFTYSGWSSDVSGTLTDNVAERVELRLESGAAYKLLTWSLSYFREKVDYESQPQTSGEAGTAKARRLLTPTLGLLAEGGYENYESGVLLAGAEGSFWKAGFEWTPTPRTRLAATGGERFYGKTYAFDLAHRTRLTTWSAGYSEGITSTRSQFIVPATVSTSAYLDALFQTGIPDPAAREQAVADLIARTGLPESLAAPVNFFTGEQFLAKRWQAAGGIMGVRNVLIVSAFKETRERLVGSSLLPVTGDFVASNTVTQTGGGIAWSLKLTATSALSANASLSRNEFFDAGRVDDLAYATVALIRQIKPKASGTLRWRRQQNESSLAGASYRENAVTVTVTMSF
jgi:uncharacterized protein (PEP-CTERM system associated)